MRYGARSTYRRKGCWLTALAAAVLLAASPASAQVTVTGPSGDTVNEGGTATYTVTVKGYIDAAAENNPTAATTVTVTLTVPSDSSPTAPTTAGEAGDVSTQLNANESVLTFNVSENTSTTDTPLFSASQILRVATTQDPDAEDEGFTATFSFPGGGGLKTTAGGAMPIATDDIAKDLTIDDDETQTYVLALDPANQKPVEGTDRHSVPHGRTDSCAAHRVVDAEYRQVWVGVGSHRHKPRHP